MVHAPLRSLLGRRVCLVPASALLLWPISASGDGPTPQPPSARDARGGTGDKSLVPGYFDAGSGTFQKMDTQSGTVTRTGTIKIVGTIVVNPGIPTSATISVTPHFRATFATTTNDVFGATVTATRTGARSATFTVTLPYTCVVPRDAASANVYTDIRSSAPGAGGTTVGWDGLWGTVVTLPPNGKTLTVKADAAV